MIAVTLVLKRLKSESFQGIIFQKVFEGRKVFEPLLTFGLLIHVSFFSLLS